MQQDKPMAYWLFASCLMVFIMLVVGGLTRLTGSGLSMVEWAPITGWIPPLNEADWQTLFAKYQTSPEFQKVNVGMDLEGFKGIFWLEFIHRVIGRLTGMVFFLPLLYFAFRQRINKKLAYRIGIIALLGGMQGVMGWLMVKSGLVDDPHVSPYRLTAHLGLAFLIFAYMFWVALSLLFSTPNQIINTTWQKLRRLVWSICSLIGITVLSGGFVAGLKAGWAYNTFPLMGGRIIPEGYLEYDPWYINFFENIAAVQWNHRFLAISTFTLVIITWIMAYKQTLPKQIQWGFHALLVMAVVQLALGISTLLLYVPTALAVTHQAGAMVLLACALFVSHRLCYQESV
ncbi:COX15/CtaA family protein [Magnetococcales bacterium HHB-1]